MKNYFQATDSAPHHISIGAVLLNDEGKVACHYYGSPSIRNYPENVYMLMHESLEPNETLEQALERGIKEEFSMEATLVRYVGSLVVSYDASGVAVEKTVLYFLCRLTKTNDRDLSDPESVSEIRWMDINKLIEIMKSYSKDNPSCDESKILIDVKDKYLNSR